VILSRMSKNFENLALKAQMGSRLADVHPWVDTPGQIAGSNWLEHARGWFSA